ncbi:MAG: Gfo/Idh/MocA family oxidoreductase, partial [Nitrosopumilaceae archaeon]|nr:Gfo/Idh/MocA family oxidoreductase [Nitrosopumilaceae archaeon]NIU87945.1 Gfo/Idh/MocA family oxidoreductase [Nitrosopumilaceae archaeon]NIX62118.1 Gfo/Idh/MocA family oxidoreductase [Nitrosopumilaceae archaeon]
MDRELLLELNRCLKEDEVSGIIIATEPKAHKIYAIWALEHNVDILMDKPLTSPMGSCTDMDAANRIYADYLELENLLEK